MKCAMEARQYFSQWEKALNGPSDEAIFFIQTTIDTLNQMQSTL